MSVPRLLETRIGSSTFMATEGCWTSRQHLDLKEGIVESSKIVLLSRWLSLHLLSRSNRLQLLDAILMM